MTAGSRKIRLAILVTRMDVGGVPDHVMTLLDGLDPSFEVTLICDNIHPSHAAEAARLGVRVVTMPMERLPGLRSDLDALRRLRAILRDNRFDLLHTHMSKAALLGGIIRVIDRSVLVVNTGHNFGFIAMPQRWKKAIFWVYDRLLSSLGHDATIAVSQTVADLALRARLIPAKRLHVIHNGIRLGRFDDSAPPPPTLRATLLGRSASEGPLILCVARLVWFKGLHTLIDALPKVLVAHPGARVLIVGDGELRADLVAQAERLGVARAVVFAGERADIPDLLKLSDLFVLPSVSEGLPISILEAMANRLPVVATNVGGISELVRDGQTGALVESGNAPALGCAISDLLSDPAKMQRYGAQGRALLEAEFNQTAMVRKTEALYRHLVASKGA